MTDTPAETGPPAGPPDAEPGAAVRSLGAPFWSTPATDTGRSLALAGILLVAVSVWIAVPVSLWELGPSLDLGFTQNNVAFVLGQTALPATLALAAGGATLGLRGLHVAAVVVTCVHLLLEVAVGAVQVILGARLPLTVDTGLEILVLGLALAGLVVARSAPLRGPTAQRLVALGLVTAAALLTILPDLFRFPVRDLLSYLPFLLPSLGGTVAVVVIAGLFGLPWSWSRYTATAALVVYAASLLLVMPWGWGLDASLLVWVVGEVAQFALLVVAAILALMAARRVQPPTPRPAPTPA